MGPLQFIQSQQRSRLQTYSLKRWIRIHSYIWEKGIWNGNIAWRTKYRGSVRKLMFFIYYLIREISIFRLSASSSTSILSQLNWHVVSRHPRSQLSCWHIVSRHPRSILSIYTFYFSLIKTKYPFNTLCFDTTKDSIELGLSEKQRKFIWEFTKYISHIHNYPPGFKSWYASSTTDNVAGIKSSWMTKLRLTTFRNSSPKPVWAIYPLCHEFNARIRRDGCNPWSTLSAANRFGERSNINFPTFMEYWLKSSPLTFFACGYLSAKLRVFHPLECMHPVDPKPNWTIFEICLLHWTPILGNFVPAMPTLVQMPLSNLNFPTRIYEKAWDSTVDILPLGWFHIACRDIRDQMDPSICNPRLRSNSIPLASADFTMLFLAWAGNLIATPRDPLAVLPCYILLHCLGLQWIGKLESKWFSQDQGDCHGVKNVVEELILIWKIETLSKNETNE